ncbi:unnamed protein product, partial [marine sediment metagenome]
QIVIYEIIFKPACSDDSACDNPIYLISQNLTDSEKNTFNSTKVYELILNGSFSTIIMLEDTHNLALTSNGGSIVKHVVWSSDPNTENHVAEITGGWPESTCNNTLKIQKNTYIDHNKDFPVRNSSQEHKVHYAPFDNIISSDIDLICIFQDVQPLHAPEFPLYMLPLFGLLIMFIALKRRRGYSVIKKAKF